MKLTDRVTIPKDVLARQVGDETVILDLVSGTYFGLDHVGTRIWQLMQEGMSLAEICEVLQVEYEVVRENLESDVVKLAVELQARKLVSLAE